MDSSSPFACVCIIGPDNAPVFMHGYTPEDCPNEFETVAYISLDFFDLPSNARQDFLPDIQASSRFRTWGYRAQLGYKVVVMTYHTSNVDETRIREFCGQISTILTAGFMDPFYTPFTPLNSEKVLKNIDNLIQNGRLGSDVM